MLLKEFYTLDSLEVSDARHTAQIKVNKDHDVFKGHFPGNPVMPGVCTIQIIKEITEKITGKKLMMQQLSNAKFMALINPEVNSELRLEIELSHTPEGLVKVKNTTYFNDTVALKLSAVYKDSL